jgi:DNA modification methylase
MSELTIYFGDNLPVLQTLPAGSIDLVYIDPPYGIKYGSNFQPFVKDRDVTDGKDEDLTAEPEQIRIPRSRETDLRSWENCRKAVEGTDLVIHLAARVGGRRDRETGR